MNTGRPGYWAFAAMNCTQVEYPYPPTGLAACMAQPPPDCATRKPSGQRAAYRFGQSTGTA
jgi:hypothetical protein